MTSGASSYSSEAFDHLNEQLTQLSTVLFSVNSPGSSASSNKLERLNKTMGSLLDQCSNFQSLKDASHQSTTESDDPFQSPQFLAFLRQTLLKVVDQTDCIDRENHFLWTELTTLADFMQQLECEKRRQLASNTDNQTSADQLGQELTSLQLTSTSQINDMASRLHETLEEIEKVKAKLPTRPAPPLPSPVTPTKPSPSTNSSKRPAPSKPSPARPAPSRPLPVTRPAPPPPPLTSVKSYKK